MSDAYTVGWYRKNVGLSHFSRVLDDTHLLEMLEKQYARESKNPELDGDGYANWLFMEAVGLFCFGQIDKGEVVLRNRCNPKHKQRILAYCVTDLTPMPKEIFSSLGNPESALSWLNDNMEHLEWSEKVGRYVFKEDSG